MNLQIVIFYKFIDVLWPSNIEKLFTSYNYFFCSFKFLTIQEKFSD